MNIVVFFSGTGTNLQSILQNEEKLNYKVISTFTNNPDASGIDTVSYTHLTLPTMLWV